MYAEELLTKQGETVLNISELLLKMKSGEKLPNNSKLSKDYKVGAGTVQAALKYLISVEAIDLISKGQQGTILSYVNYEKLLQLCGNPIVRGVMPLPNSIQFEGLATGLYKNFDKSATLLKMTYVRGGKKRLDLLLDGMADFIICSRMTAEKAKEEHPEICILTSFGSKSYVSRCGILFKDPNSSGIKDGMRIGVDTDSYDHIALNEYISRNHDVVQIPIKYSDVATLFESSVMDATFWSLDNYKNASNGKIIEFTGDEDKIVSDTMEGVLICLDDSDKKLLLNDILAVDKIRCIQDQVIAGKRIPSY